MEGSLQVYSYRIMVKAKFKLQETLQILICCYGICKVQKYNLPLCCPPWEECLLAPDTLWGFLCSVGIGGGKWGANPG